MFVPKAKSFYRMKSGRVFFVKFSNKDHCDVVCPLEEEPTADNWSDYELVDMIEVLDILNEKYRTK